MWNQRHVTPCLGIPALLVPAKDTECSHLVWIWPETSGVTKEKLQGPMLTVFWKLLRYQSVIDFEVCLWLVGCFNLSPLLRKKPGGCYRGFCSPLPGSGTQHCKVKGRWVPPSRPPWPWQAELCLLGSQYVENPIWLKQGHLFQTCTQQDSF